MKELRFAAFTKEGGNLCRSLVRNFSGKGFSCEGYLPKKYLTEQDALKDYGCSLEQWMRKQFQACDALVLIGSCDFAVRAAAPFLKDKASDPAVLSVDEQNGIAVCLSGGRNNCGDELLKELGSVQTIAAGAGGFSALFQPKAWAFSHHCAVSDAGAEESISAALLDGERVSFYSQLPVSSELPEGLTESNAGEMGIALSYQNELPDEVSFQTMLRLYPKCLVLGVCCRKGVDTLVLERQILAVLHRENISLNSIAGVYSIDSRRDEPALCTFVEKYHLPFVTYSADELLKVSGTFEASIFAEPVDGVENVCERAAVLGSGGELIVKKQAGNGVTVAVAKQDWKADFKEELSK
jgi:cobalt-precorrin 5A hydrolase